MYMRRRAWRGVVWTADRRVSVSVSVWTADGRVIRVWAWRVCGDMEDGMRQDVSRHGEGVGQVGRPGARRVRGGAPRGRRREGHGRVKREEVRSVGSRVG